MPFVTSLGVGAHLEAWACRRAHHRARLVGEHRAPGADLTFTAAPVAALLGPRAARDRNATLWSSWCRGPRAIASSSAATPAYAGVRGYPRAARAVRPRDARGRRLPPRWGDIHLGPRTRFGRSRCSAAARSCPFTELLTSPCIRGTSRPDAACPGRTSARAHLHAGARPTVRACAHRRSHSMVARGPRGVVAEAGRARRRRSLIARHGGSRVSATATLRRLRAARSARAAAFASAFASALSISSLRFGKSFATFFALMRLRCPRRAMR